MYRFLYLIAISFFCSSNLIAQIVDDIRFNTILDEMELSLLYPVEANYNSVAVIENTVQPYDFAIWSRKEKLEIRYFLEPYQEADKTFETPHIRASRLLLNLAANDEESIITGHAIKESELKEQFQADWGKVFYFRPKSSFSPLGNCKMLALFREGQGMAYVFFLFRKPTVELEKRFYAIQFNSPLTGN